jgi:hypothetical protein
MAQNQVTAHTMRVMTRIAPDKNGVAAAVSLWKACETPTPSKNNSPNVAKARSR